MRSLRYVSCLPNLSDRFPFQPNNMDPFYSFRDDDADHKKDASETYPDEDRDGYGEVEVAVYR